MSDRCLQKKDYGNRLLIESQRKHRRKCRFLRQRQGSAVLLLSIIVMPLILILTTLFLGARYQADLLDLDRALSAQVQTRLAGFNKELYDEFGLLALDDKERADCFERMLPTNLQHLQLSQNPGDALNETDNLKESILSFMRLRLPAAALRTIAEQTGFSFGSGTAKPAAIVFQDYEAGYSANTIETSALEYSAKGDESAPDHDMVGKYIPDADDEPEAKPVIRITTVEEALPELLSNAVFELLDQELKDALEQYRRFTNDCAADGDKQQLVTMPNLFEPEQLADFTEILSSAMTMPTGGVYKRLAIREYILNTFWPAGKPGRQTLLPGSSSINDGNRFFRNLSGSRLDKYPGREAGEVEQILTGASSPAKAVGQVKAILIVYRAALFIGRKLLSDQGIAGYRATAAVIAAALAATTSVVVEPQILAYVLLICDGLRNGFQDYSRLLNGERLSFTQKPGHQALSLDYLMHLRILLLLSPDSKLLTRTAEIINKRHSGRLATGISISCIYRGQQYNRSGSLLTVGTTA